MPLNTDQLNLALRQATFGSGGASAISGRWDQSQRADAEIRRKLGQDDMRISIIDRAARPVAGGLGRDLSAGLVGFRHGGEHCETCASWHFSQIVPWPLMLIFFTHR